MATGHRRQGGTRAGRRGRVWAVALGGIALLVLAVLYGLARPGLGNRGHAPTTHSLKVGITQEFESLNPLIMQMLATSYLYRMVNRTLVTIDEDAHYQAQLAVKIPTLENGLARFVDVDGVRKLEADWEILPAATWGDGVPVTCHDLELAWEIAQSPYVSIAGTEIYRQVEVIRIDPANPKRCTFLYRQTKWQFNRIFQFFLLPAHLERPVFEAYGDQPEGYEKHTLYTTDPTNPGLYHGPYRIRDIKLGSHIVFERNPTFYGEPAKIETIVTMLIPNTGTLEANLRSGSIDMVSTLGMSFDQALAFARRVEAADLPFSVNIEPGFVYEHIDLDLDEPALQDVRVRRALVHAIDRKRLTDALFEGQQPPALHFIAPVDPSYTEDPARIVLYPHSRRTAARLLEEAGWSLREDGFRYDAAGNRLRLRLMTTAGNKMREIVQVYLQDQWRAIGVDTRIQNEPARIFFGQTMRRRLFDGAAMYAWTQSPEFSPRTTLHSAEIPSEENGWSGQNTPGWSNPRVDALIEEYEVEFDAGRRLDLLYEIAWHYTDEVPVIPLYYRSNTSVTPANMTGYRLSSHQVSSSDHVERWNLLPVPASGKGGAAP
jgi:peptide/nickel transport system substrate-binding protein